ncbi:MAG: sodium/solute symporter [Opitutaceae bacterium]|jgi:SSS family transporter|nr:sodium/solute symporter [Opitutaceae bacterium]
MTFTKKIFLIISGFISLGVATAAMGRASVPVRETPAVNWTQLPSIPDKEGFAGSYGGVAGGALVIAGGANFPDARPWEGGVKTWYDKVFVLESGATEWRAEGRLPKASGYGLSLPWKDGFLIIGGGDARANFKSVWQVTRPAGGGVTFAALPDLPRALAMQAGAVVKNYVYVAGGLETPVINEAANVLYRLNMNNTAAGWETLEPCPGGARFLATAGAVGETFYIFGGARPDGSQAKRVWLTDAWSYHPEFGWKQLADLPHPVVAPPSPAMPVGQTHLFLLGGDDGAQIGITDPGKHMGFPRAMLAYHTITNTWTNMGDVPFSLVTTTLVPWDGGFVVTGGERMPGIRSTEVWQATVIVTKAAFGWINYAALVAYLLGMVGIGWMCTKRNKSTDDYFKAGGRIPWWAAGIAIYATMLSSLTFMAIPAKAYATDWTYFWANVPIFLIAPVLIAVYLPFFRRLNVTSAYEYLEKRFSLPVRLYGSAAFILFQVGRQAIVLLLPSIALATVSDLNVSTCIVLMGFLCVLYTVMGGMEAVIWTDVAQTFVLIGAALVSFLLIAFGTEGGISGLWATAVANNKFHMFNFTWSPTTAANAFWVVFIGNIFAQLVPYTSDQAVVQRYMTTDSEKKAAGSIWFNAVLAIPSGILFFLIGTALFVFYKSHPAALDPSQATDAIFPAFIVQNLPVGIAGLVIAGIFAAAQSTVSGSLNSVVTAIMTDFYGRLGGKAKDAAALRLARILTALLGVFATVCALVLAKLNLASLWDAYSSLVGLAASGLAGLFALGIFTKRASGLSALIGAVASIAVLYYVQRHTNLHFFLYAGIGMLTCFFAGWIASIVLPSKKNIDGLTFRTLKK